jgi:hypothetical protein
MASADQATIGELRRMLSSQLKIESDWYQLKHKIAETALKDEIAVAFAQCRDRLQFLVDSFSN